MIKKRNPAHTRAAKPTGQSTFSGEMVLLRWSIRNRIESAKGLIGDLELLLAEMDKLQEKIEEA